MDLDHNRPDIATYPTDSLLRDAGVGTADIGAGLLIECSGRAGSVAVATLQGLLHEIVLPPEQATARTLAPAVSLLLKHSGLSVGELAYVAVTAGPGSFTGVRIGAALARSIGFAAGIPLAAVSSLETLANSATNAAASSRGVDQTRADCVIAATNAFRQEVFAAAFRIPKPGAESLTTSARGFERLADDCRVPIGDFADWIAALDASGRVGGAGRIEVASPEQAAFFSAAGLPAKIAIRRTDPRASSMLPIVVGGWPSILCTTPDECLPVYLRGSAAEEQRAIDPPAEGQ